MRAVGDQNLEFEVSGSGVLDSQLPAADQWLESGSKVRLIFHQTD
ncbi:MAG: hypothetical protein HY074_11480 [Deltaproteobacteria bacterium]|nr:hypothetical protein [Deltaproteobacteria bacterium]